MRRYGVKRRWDSDQWLTRGEERSEVKREGEQIVEEQMHDHSMDELEALEHSVGACDCEPWYDETQEFEAAPVWVSEFTCRLCGYVMGDFWYCPTEDCCCACLGLEFPP